MTKSYQLPFSIMPKILNAVADISELLGRWSAAHQGELSPQLRRENRIRTIQASLRYLSSAKSEHWQVALALRPETIIN